MTAVYNKLEMDQETPDRNNTVIRPLIEFMSELFTQGNEFRVNQNGEMKLVKKPLRMVCLSVVLLLTCSFIFLLILLYKLALSVMNNNEFLEILFEKQCENDEQKFCPSRNESFLRM